MLNNSFNYSLIKHVLSAMCQAIMSHRNNSNDYIQDRFIISQYEAERKLFDIDVNKVIGLDNLSNWIFRDLTAIVSGPICAIFNKSI